MSATDTVTSAPAARNGELVNRVQQLRLDTQLGAAKAGRGGAGWLPWVLCGLLAATWAAVAVRTYRATPVVVEATEAQPAAATASAGTTAAAPPPPAGTIQLEVKGYLVPARQIAVSPIEVAGRIVELNVIEGKLFKQGDVLARIDDTSYRTAADEADATVASAQNKLEAAQARLAELLPSSVRKVELQQVEAELREAEAMRARAADDLKRYKGIPGTVAARELVQAEADNQTAAAKSERLKATLQILTEGPRKERITAVTEDVQAAEADVKAAQARQAQAVWRLRNCVITAPIAGTALTKKTELGSLVNPLAFSASSGSVCDIADLADMEADLEIPERDIAKLVVGQPCRIKADAFPDKVYQGRLDRIMPTANRAKSIVNVRVKVALPDGEVPGTYLKPEMGAVVSFLPAKN